MAAIQFELGPPTEVGLDNASTLSGVSSRTARGWRDTSKAKSRGLGQSEPGMYNPKATHDHHHH
jgi:hypothetical protein